MPQQENQEVINFLNQQVSNFSVLYVKLHRYHWFVQGQQFFELHEKFQSLYEEASEIVDEIAERVLAIQGKPVATMEKYLHETTLKEAEADDEPSEMLMVLHNNFKQINEEIKQGRILCEKHDDVVSADMLTHLQGKLEKHQWMLRSTLTQKQFHAVPEPVHI